MSAFFWGPAQTLCRRRGPWWSRCSSDSQLYCTGKVCFYRSCQKKWKKSLLRSGTVRFYDRHSFFWHRAHIGCSHTVDEPSQTPPWCGWTWNCVFSHIHTPHWQTVFHPVVVSDISHSHCTESSISSTQDHREISQYLPNRTAIKVFLWYGCLQDLTWPRLYKLERARPTGTLHQLKTGKKTRNNTI